MTEVIAVNATAPEADRIARAAACLRSGGLVAFPTETVYGLGVHALDREAVRRLFAAKGRPANDPIIVHVSAIEEIAPLVVAIPADAARLAARFWPGPLTIVMQRSGRVPDAITAGLDTVAIRIPAHPVAQALISASGLPVGAPSANLFSRPSPTTAAHVLEDLRDRIDMVVDGGPTPVGVESTVLSLAGRVPTLLRPGAITLDMLRDVIPQVQARRDLPAEDAAPQVAPGMLSKHYSPRAPMTLYRGERETVRAEIERDRRRLESEGKKVAVIETGDEPADVARRIYGALRAADAQQSDVILAADLSGSDGLRAAIRDRLRRAAAEIREI